MWPLNCRNLFCLRWNDMGYLTFWQCLKCNSYNNLIFSDCHCLKTCLIFTLPVSFRWHERWPLCDLDLDADGLGADMVFNNRISLWYQKLKFTYYRGLVTVIYYTTGHNLEDKSEVPLVALLGDKRNPPSDIAITTSVHVQWVSPFFHPKGYITASDVTAHCR